jgi:histone acetyltransferase (RNA polymerase elongator complex component)
MDRSEFRVKIIPAKGSGHVEEKRYILGFQMDMEDKGGRITEISHEERLKWIKENLKRARKPEIHFIIEMKRKTILVGTTGHIYWYYLNIDSLWGDESLKGKGYGKELLDNIEKITRVDGLSNWIRLASKPLIFIKNMGMRGVYYRGIPYRRKSPILSFKETFILNIYWYKRTC